MLALGVKTKYRQLVFSYMQSLKGGVDFPTLSFSLAFFNPFK